MCDKSDLDPVRMRRCDWMFIHNADFHVDNVQGLVARQVISCERRWISSWCRFSHFHKDMQHFKYRMQMHFPFSSAFAEEIQVYRLLRRLSLRLRTLVPEILLSETEAKRKKETTNPGVRDSLPGRWQRRVRRVISERTWCRKDKKVFMPKKRCYAAGRVETRGSLPNG